MYKYKKQQASITALLIAALYAPNNVAGDRYVIEVLGGEEDRLKHQEIFSEQTNRFLATCGEHGQPMEYCHCIHENGNGVNGYHIFNMYVKKSEEELLAMDEGSIWSIFPEIIRVRRKCGYPIESSNVHNK